MKVNFCKFTRGLLQLMSVIFLFSTNSITSVTYAQTKRRRVAEPLRLTNRNNLTGYNSSTNKFRGTATAFAPQ